jgi:hypothetical protein
MAEVKKEPAKVDKEFRREAAMRILEAFVARHGGFQPESMEVHMRQVWTYADVFVSLEDAPPPAPVPVPEFPSVQKRRAAHPADEWGVRENGRLRRGFVSEEEALLYAASRPGAEVQQVAGPAAEKSYVAANA